MLSAASTKPGAVLRWDQLCPGALWSSCLGAAWVMEFDCFVRSLHPVRSSRVGTGEGESSEVAWGSDMVTSEKIRNL